MGTRSSPTDYNDELARRLHRLEDGLKDLRSSTMVRMADHRHREGDLVSPEMPAIDSITDEEGNAVEGELTLTTGANENRIYIDAEWTQVDGVKNYDIELQTPEIVIEEGDPEEGDSTVQTSNVIVSRVVTDRSSMRFEPVEPLTDYIVVVRIIFSNVAGPVDYLTGSITSGRDETAPAKVEGLTGGAGYKTITVRWDDVPDADVRDGNGQYEVQLATDSAFNTVVRDTRVGGTVTSFTDLTAGTEYWVRVRAIDASGNHSEEWSDSISLTPGDVEVPDLTDGDPPSASPAASVSAGIGFLVVKWAPVENDDPVIYHVHVSTTNDFSPNSGTKHGEAGSSTVYFLTTTAGGTDLDPETTYYVKIIATDADGAASPGTQDSGSPLTETEFELQADSILEEHIADGAVASDKLQDDSVSTAKIVDDAITAAKASFSVGGSNLFSYSSAENGDTTLWESQSSADLDAVELDSAPHGDWVFRTTRVGTGSAMWITTRHAAPNLPEGTIATVSVWAMWPSESDTPNSLRIRVRDLGAGNTFHTEYFTVPPADTWVRCVTTFEVPAGLNAEYYYIGFHGGNTTDDVYYYDAVQLELGDVATAYAPKTDEILPGTIDTEKLADDAVTTQKLVDDAIESAKLAGEAVTEAKLAEAAVTLQKIADGAVNTQKLVDDAITEAKLAADSVVATKIADGAIIEAKLQDGIISTNKLVDDAITAAKIEAGAVTQAKLADGSVVETKLAEDSVTTQKLVDDAITNAKLAADAVQESNVASGAITTAKIVDDAINAAKLAADAVQEGNVASGAITTQKLVDDAITAAKLASNSVTQAKIANGAVIEAKIANGAITTTKIVDDAITAAKIEAGSIDITKLSDGVRPIQTVETLPTLPDSDYPPGESVVLLSTDGKLYRNDDDTWTAGVDTSDISGQITETQIADDAISTPKLQANAVEADKIAANQIDADHLTANSVTAGKIEAGAVVTDKLAANAVVAGKIDAGAIEASHISAGAIETDALAANAVVADKIAAGTITASEIASNAIIAVKISAGAVEADKIAANAVTAAKIAADAIEAGHISAGAIETDALAADAVVASKIAAGSIDTNHLAADAITAGKIDAGAVEAIHIKAGAIETDALAADSVVASKIAAGVIDTDHLAANSIVAGKIAAGAIEASHVSAGAIETNALAANAVVAGKIAADAVTADKILAGEIGTSHLAADAVTAGKIDAGAIEASHISAGAIETAALDANAVTAAKIAAGTITASEIASNAITAIKINANAVTAAKIAAGAIEAGHISANAIEADAISAGAVETDALAANAVVAGKIAADAIGANHIEAGAIDTEHLAAGAITAGKIESGTITTDHIAAVGLDAEVIKAGTIDTARILIGPGINFDSDDYDPTLKATPDDVEDAKAEAIEYTRHNTGNLIQNPQVEHEPLRWHYQSNNSANDNTDIATHANLTTKMEDFSGQDVRVVNLINSNGLSNHSTRTAPFEIDPSKAYQVTVWFKEGEEEAGRTYLGVVAYSDREADSRIGSQTINDNTGSVGSENTNVYVNTNVPLDTLSWTRCTFYILPPMVDGNDIIGMGENISSHVRILSHTRSFRLRVLNWSGGTAGGEVLIGMPRVVEIDIDSAIKGNFGSKTTKLWQHEDTTFIDGGTIATDTILANSILAGEIKTAHLEANAVTAGKIAADAIEAIHISADAIEADAIKAGAVSADKISADWISGNNLVIGGTGTDYSTTDHDPTTKATPSDVSTAKTEAISDAATAADNEYGHARDRVVLWQHEDTTFIDGGAIFADSVTANEIATATIAADSAFLNALEVGTAQIADAAITNAKINDLNASKVTAGTIATARLDTGAIAANQAFLDNLEVDTAQIANGAITNAKIDTLNADKITAGTISTDRLNTGAIAADSAFLSNLTVDTAQIANTAITNAKIQSLNADKITAGTIDASVISVINLNADNIITGTITANRISGGTLSLSTTVNGKTYHVNTYSGRVDFELDNSLVGRISARYDTMGESSQAGNLIIGHGDIGYEFGSPHGKGYSEYSPESAIMGVGWNYIAANETGTHPILTSASLSVGGSIAFSGNIVSLSDGSSSAPVYGFSSNTNSGMYITSTGVVTSFNGSWKFGAGSNGLVVNGDARGGASPGGNPAGNNELGFNLSDSGYISTNRSGGGTAAFFGTRFTSGTHRVVQFYNNGSVRGWVLLGSTGAAFESASDYRLKENERPIEDGLDRLFKLKPYRFNFKSDPSQTMDGFFAHEVQEIVPEAASGEKDAVDEDNNPEIQGLDPAKLVPLLVAAVQELTQQVRELQTEAE